MYSLCKRFENKNVHYRGSYYTLDIRKFVMIKIHVLIKDNFYDTFNVLSEMKLFWEVCYVLRMYKVSNFSKVLSLVLYVKLIIF